MLHRNIESNQPFFMIIFKLERFLDLCAEDNMQVVNCTTPANFFHVLRRQLKREFRKPLVVLTPKSLLRHPRCVSAIDDLTTGSFKEIIEDTSADPAIVTKLVLCSGKIYYELLDQKEKDKTDDIALVRIEQLYPFPEKQFRKILSRYKKLKSTTWVQEEPENMGAWGFLLLTLRDIKLEVISRPASASPATGAHHAHDREQRELIDKVFRKAAVKSKSI